MGRSRKKNPDGRQPEGSDQSVKIKSADEGEAEEKETSPEDKHRSRARQGKRPVSDRELRWYVLLLTILLVALILVVVVLVSDGFRDIGTDMTADTTGHMAEASPDNTEIPVIEPDTKEYFHDFGGSILSQDTVPEINQLMEQYFLSISECDMATFLHLFVSEDTSEEEYYRQDFEKQRQYIEGYQNISCYTTPGLEEDSYAAYIYYEIKYTGVETPAPSLVRIYAVKGSDGVYRIYDQAVSPELESFLDQLAINEDVRLLISQVDQKAEEAMAADPALNDRIQYMKKGPDYMRDEETGVSQGREEDIPQEASN